MALPGELSSENVTPQGVGSAQAGVTKGLDAGLAYAQAKQTSEMNDQKLSEMKDTHEAQKNSYLMDQLDKASSTDNKQLRRIHLDGVDTTMQKFYGAPLSKPVRDFIQNVPESSELIQALVKKYPEFSKDPKQLAQFSAALVGGLKSPTLADANKSIGGIAEITNKGAIAEGMQSMREEGLSLKEKQLALRQSVAEQNAIKNAQNSPQVQDSEIQLLGAKKGLGIVQQGIANYKKTGKTITWSQVHEGYGDLAGLTSAKLSAVIPVARQAGIEKDLPIVDSLVGTIQTNFDHSPAENVPIGNLRKMEQQFKSIQKVIEVYHKEQMDKRLKAGVVSGVLRKESADQFSPQISQDSTTSTATSTDTSTATDPIQGIKNFKSLYPNTTYDQLTPGIKAKVDRKTYESL